MKIADFRTVDGIRFLDHSGRLFEVAKTTGGVEVQEVLDWSVTFRVAVSRADPENHQIQECQIWIGGGSRSADNLYASRVSAHRAAAEAAFAIATKHIEQAGAIAASGGAA